MHTDEHGTTHTRVYLCSPVVSSTAPSPGDIGATLRAAIDQRGDREAPQRTAKVLQLRSPHRFVETAAGHENTKTPKEPPRKPRCFVRSTFCVLVLLWPLTLKHSRLTPSRQGAKRSTAVLRALAPPREPAVAVLRGPWRCFAVAFQSRVQPAKNTAGKVPVTSRRSP